MEETQAWKIKRTIDCADRMGPKKNIGGTDIWSKKGQYIVLTEETLLNWAVLCASAASINSVNKTKVKWRRA
jgi:hypothetical protein